ncbi:MAG: hypothetical protein FD189_764 [Elusimicrobia bacterium]|nr:MAG: hypothetical protein FD154_695 [Elusimicrobiota bacterium]KAF0157010.1 MAG: hypothetical protein FD189_764 [Elusimicrobiota bacterium]
MNYLLAIAVAVLAVLAGWFVTVAGPGFIVLGALAVGISIFAFFSPRLSLLLVVFSMLLSPEIPVGGAISERHVVVRYDDILIAIIFISWFARTAIEKGRAFIVDTPAHKPILIYTALCVVSTGLGILRGDINPKVSFFYVVKYIQYFLLYFMTVNIVRDPAEIKKYLKAALLVAAIVTVYAYYYYFNSGPDGRSSAPFEAAVGSPGESEPASLGGYYLILFGVLLGLVVHAPLRVSAAAIAAMLAVLPVFMATYSRASYIGLTAMVPASFIIFSRRKLFLFTALLGMLIVGVILPGISEKTRERVRMTYTGELATRGVEFMGVKLNLEESAYLRYNSLRRVLTEHLPKHPLLGRGVTGIGLGDNQYALVLGELGIIGFFVFLWMLYSVFGAARAVSLAYDEFWIKAVSTGLMVALVGLLFQGLGVNTFIIVRIMEPFWMLTAFVMVLHGGIPPRRLKAEDA